IPLHRTINSPPPRLANTFQTRVMPVSSDLTQKIRFSQRRSILRTRLLYFLSVFLMLVACSAYGQTAPDSQTAPSSTPADQPKPADPQPLSMPSMSGPLQTAVPHEVEGGKLAVTGILSGIGWTEGNHIAGDSASHWDVSNAQ